MLLILSSHAEGYIGALETPSCFSLREDVVITAHEAGLDLRLSEAYFTPTDSERAVVRSVVSLIGEVMERRQAEQL